MTPLEPAGSVADRTGRHTTLTVALFSLASLACASAPAVRSRPGSPLTALGTEQWVFAACAVTAAFVVAAPLVAATRPAADLVSP